MTTPKTRTASPAPALSPELRKVLAGLRAKQSSPELAEQRHQFLDIDSDLDYARAATVGGELR